MSSSSSPSLSPRRDMNLEPTALAASSSSSANSDFRAFAHVGGNTPFSPGKAREKRQRAEAFPVVKTEKGAAAAASSRSAAANHPPVVKTEEEIEEDIKQESSSSSSDSEDEAPKPRHHRKSKKKSHRHKVKEVTVRPRDELNAKFKAIIDEMIFKDDKAKAKLIQRWNRLKEDRDREMWVRQNEDPEDTKRCGCKACGHGKFKPLSGFGRFGIVEKRTKHREIDDFVYFTYEICSDCQDNCMDKHFTAIQTENRARIAEIRKDERELVLATNKLALERAGRVEQRDRHGNVTVISSADAAAAAAYGSGAAKSGSQTERRNAAFSNAALGILGQLGGRSKRR